jgi:tellurite resistance protein TerC
MRFAIEAPARVDRRMDGRDRGTLTSTFRAVRKIAIAVAGASVVAVGVLMLVLPGPAFFVIPAGLAILGLEFAWARRWLLHVREHGDRAIRSWRTSRDTRS